MTRCLIAMVMTCCALPVVRATEPMVMELHPGVTLPSVSLGDEKVEDRGKDGKHDRIVTNVTLPTLTVYLPAAEKNTGTSVVICPGGGYHALAIDKEGYDVAEWLNSVGVAGVVLKYRMPHPEMSKGEKPWPLLDAQNAIRTVRAKAAEWRLDPHRVGIMGFSAGGHLASTASTHYDTDTRPDFAVLVYPVITLHPPFAHTGSATNLLGKEPEPAWVDLYSNDQQVNAQTPPTLLVHAEDDGVKCENSLRYFMALRSVKVPCELLLYPKGGHGFGLGTGRGEVATWPERCAAWMVDRKTAIRK